MSEKSEVVSIYFTRCCKQTILVYLNMKYVNSVSDGGPQRIILLTSGQSNHILKAIVATTTRRLLSEENRERIASLTPGQVQAQKTCPLVETMVDWGPQQDA